MCCGIPTCKNFSRKKKFCLEYCLQQKTKSNYDESKKFKKFNKSAAKR